jgi:IS5 family transposase
MEKRQKASKPLHQEMRMYREKDQSQLEFNDFYLPFGGKLREGNRWVKLAKIIPWNDFEAKYASLFSKDQGAPAKPFRMALGSLLIRERLGLTDEETVEQIRENHYLQYFTGMTEYQDEAPFDPSMMVHFRKRLTVTMLSEINELIVISSIKSKNNKPNDNDKNFCTRSDEDESAPHKSPEKNSGIMMVDASVAPADIAYPTDLNLLNEAREKLEKIIDHLYKGHHDAMAKPRTYRKCARKDYLWVAKKRKVSWKERKKALRKQLQYVKRDLGHVDMLVSRFNNLCVLSRREYRDLLVIQELYRQQEYMYRNKTHSIDDRIVSISQPHVRPIVRGKASANVEFGAKIAVSNVEGFALLEHCSWDAYNESTLLKDQINKYHNRFGHYPEAVLVDKLYRTRENIQFCTELKIRISGPRLGRPPKDASVDKKQEYKDSGMRNGIEGIFGTGKRKYSLGNIMMKLDTTSESAIALILLVMNLEKVLRNIFVLWIYRYISSLRWLRVFEFKPN